MKSPTQSANERSTEGLTLEEAKHKAARLKQSLKLEYAGTQTPTNSIMGWQLCDFILSLPTPSTPIPNSVGEHQGSVDVGTPANKWIEDLFAEWLNKQDWRNDPEAKYYHRAKSAFVDAYHQALSSQSEAVAKAKAELSEAVKRSERETAARCVALVKEWVDEDRCSIAVMEIEAEFLTSDKDSGGA